MRQKLGQHFLENEKLLRRIVGALGELRDTSVVEIGPGHGELTDLLLAGRPSRLIALERDPKLAARLREDYENDPRVRIIEGDALEHLAALSRELQHYLLVGNIPYYITGFLLRTIGELEHKPERTLLLVQREVAERIVAEPPRMNLLAAMVQAWARPELLEAVSPENFNPPPKVDSAVLRLETSRVVPTPELAAYIETVRGVFKQPRKTLLNNLREATGYETERTLAVIERAGVSRNDRPQNLSVENLRAIATAIRDKRW